MTRKLELDRISQAEEARAFVEAVRHGDSTQVGGGSYTASGTDKDKMPQHTLGAGRFTASGDGKAVAGGRVLGTGDFTASGDAKPKDAPAISGVDFTATGGKPKPAPAISGTDFTATGMGKEF